MKKKWYAVRKGRNPGIYETWDECRAETNGFSGAIYKSFPSREEAQAFINAEENSGSQVGSNAVENVSKDPSRNVKPSENNSAGDWNLFADEIISSLKENEAAAFVDGSFNAASQKGGYGVIYWEKDGEKSTLSGSFSGSDHPDLCQMRNVAAELLGVRSAVEKAVSQNKSKLTIFYDYAGIGCWADGSWKTNLPATTEYAAFIRENRSRITLIFHKVPAHSGVSFNEEVDALAKAAADISS